MKPKTKTRLLALGGLTALGCVHFMPERWLPFRSRELVGLVAAGLLLGAHRNPLKVLYKDTVALLPAEWTAQLEAGRPETVATSG
jgi:hypothetical protein